MIWLFYQVIKGAINLNLGVDEVYTLTTLKTGTKGNFTSGIPDSKPFPLPYQDDFEGIYMLIYTCWYICVSAQYVLLM